jgi:hypothetical protein
MAASGVIMPRFVKPFRVPDDCGYHVLFFVVVEDALLEAFWHSGYFDRLPGDF